MKKIVYLAGPITGMSHAYVIGWRDEVTALLSDDFELRSPLRDQPEIIDLAAIPDFSDAEYERRMFLRNVRDYEECDVVLINFLGATRVSIGTIGELNWAFRDQKPCVIVMEPGNLHDHSCIRQTGAHIVPTIPDAISFIRSLSSNIHAANGS